MLLYVLDIALHLENTKTHKKKPCSFRCSYNERWLGYNKDVGVMRTQRKRDWGSQEGLPRGGKAHAQLGRNQNASWRHAGVKAGQQHGRERKTQYLQDCNEFRVVTARGVCVCMWVCMWAHGRGQGKRWGNEGFSRTAREFSEHDKDSGLGFTSQPPRSGGQFTTQWLMGSIWSQRTWVQLLGLSFSS